MNYLDLHANSIVIDGHSDIPLYMFKNRQYNKKPFIKDHLPLLKEGGINIVFINLFENLHPEGSLKEALTQVGDIYKELEETEEAILIKNKKDLNKVLKENKIGLVLSMEGLEPISNEISLLSVFHELGLRCGTLTWNHRNYFASGLYEIGGLSNLGKAAVKEMERLNIVVDVSHLNEEGFWDVISIVEKPIIASHSNAKAVYNHPRNLTDEQVKAIVNTKGVIGLNGYFTQDIDKESLNTYMEHLEYLLDIAGEDHVGLGFDFNSYLGDGGLKDLEDCTKTSNVTKELIKRGYKEETIKKVLGLNFLRILEGILL
ncbi:dipeptidase [Tissierella sp. MSJ-40]|uniref:Dipeptidase n=1 Tax=Tissierella simiarum TaxID=2841534 RepID=A0ABS6E8K1_9FIRM|nr:dipeptidase [Tissierella simiarum]MBU5439245.1 dipeptidase [Tissierella simiarum]